MRKLSKQVVLIGLLSLLVVSLRPISVQAEDTDYSDTNYWNTLCSGDSLSAAEQTACKGYIEYLKTENTTIQSSIADATANRGTIADNLEAAQLELSTYTNQVDSLNEMIADLNYQLDHIEEEVAAKQGQIDALKASVKQQQDEITDLQNKIKARMAQSQSTMRLNPYLDVIMGAHSFNDLVLLLNGMTTINERDRNDMITLNNKIQELELMQAQLQSEQDALTEMQDQVEGAKAALDAQQADLLVKTYEIGQIENTYAGQLAAADDALNNGQGTIDANNATIGDITGNLDGSGNEAVSTPEQGVAGAPTQGDSSGNPYYGGWGNCTWSAWQIAHDDYGATFPNFGGSAVWLSNAARLGYATGSTPAVYSIMVFNYPHVAVVTQINGDMVYIREGNYLGAYHERWVNVSEAQGFIYF